MRGRWFESEELERRARELLCIYRRRSKAPLRLPIQADLVAESVGLDILWEPIPEEPGRTILAEIRPDDRLIVVNEDRLHLSWHRLHNRLLNYGRLRYHDCLLR
ncbi:MAG: hypothetical protein M3R38_22720 [Actinomycetota bacterium]|nr:hypothetical protein [Actinomycetota bacterium]